MVEFLPGASGPVFLCASDGFRWRVVEHASGAQIALVAAPIRNQAPAIRMASPSPRRTGSLSCLRGAQDQTCLIGQVLQVFGRICWSHMRLRPGRPVHSARVLPGALLDLWARDGISGECLRTRVASHTPCQSCDLSVAEPPTPVRPKQESTLMNCQASRETGFSCELCMVFMHGRCGWMFYR